jgi:hypothetical protein
MRTCGIGAVVAWIGALVLAAGLGGCAGLEEAGSLRSRAAALQSHYGAESRAWERRLADMDEDDPLRPGIRAALARARAKEAAAAAAIEQVNQVVRESTNPYSTGDAAGALALLVPDPLRVPLLLGSALALSLARAAQLKRGMASIARGLEKAMDDDEQFAGNFRRHANTFRTMQTRTARRVVDEATADRFMLRLPI